MNARPGYLGLYWGPRPVAVDVAADLCVRGFDELAKNGLTAFYLKGRSRAEALHHPFFPTAESVRNLLKKGRNRRDTDRTVIERLGFSMSLWSGGQDGESYSLSALLGASSPFVQNSFVLTLPAAGPFSLAGHEPMFEDLRLRLSAVFSPDSSVLRLNE